MTAESFYDWVRASARDIERIDRQLARSRVTPTPSALTGARSGTGPADAMAVRVASMVDEQARLEGDRARCVRVVEMGRQLAARIARWVGQDAADAIVWYYVELNDWEAVAFELGLSIATVYRRRRTAFDWVDRMGLVVHADEMA